jgi:myo-inositol-1(or 4)-monophosphatase
VRFGLTVPEPDGVVPYSRLRALAEEVAREAGRHVREARESGSVEVSATKSSAVDLVTETDRATEQLVRRLLLAARPDDGFIGEEGDERVARSDVTWVVDPVDGTVNFVYGIPEYAVSIAARVAGRSVAGAVVNAATGVTYSAALGGGATRDGRPLAVREVPPMEQRLLLTGFGYEAHQRRVQGAAVARILPHVRDIRRRGSAALELCALAEGSADAFIEEGLNLWDHAAGSLVAEEAGASVTFHPGAGGRPCLVAAPAGGHAELVDLARECGFLA